MNRSLVRGTRRAAAVLLTLSLAAAGCGDDDDETTSDTTAASSATTAGAETTTGETESTAGGSETTTGGGQAATGEPIKIGVAVALTGVQSGGVFHAADTAKAWAEWVNANGGVAGHPVEMLVEDTKSDPATGQSVVSSLVEDGVVAMIILDNVAEGAGAPVLQQNGVALLGTGYNNDVFSKLPNVYSHTTTIPAVVTEQLLAPVSLGLGTFAAMSCAESPSCAQADLIYKPTAEALGLRYGGLLTVAASAPNYTAECLQFINDDMDYIQMSTANAVAIRIAQDCLRQGYEGRFGASAGTAVVSEMTKAEGSTWAGGLHGFPWFADAPAAQEFRDAMAEVAPDVDYRDPTSSGTWSALQLFRKALTDAGETGEVTPQTVTEAYSQVKDETLDGLLPQPLTFTAGQPAAEVECFWLYEYKAGDENPTLLPIVGESGNGETGDLATSCMKSSQ